MKKFITFLLLFFLVVNNSISQDVVISGLNTDSGGTGTDLDAFAVVALVDIPASQNIFLTDMPYDATTNSFTDAGTPGDGIMKINWTGTWAKGTIIRAVETGVVTNTFVVTSSANGPSSPGITVINDGFSIGGSEGINLFTSSNLVNPNLNVEEIYSFYVASSSDPNPNSDADCPCSADFVGIGFGDSNVDAVNFTPALRGNALSLFDYTNTGNWTTSSSSFILDLTEFTNLTFGGSGLPVELTSFIAQPKERSTLLTWQTASERNNHYFQIEHSIDGRNFFELDKVAGVGNSIEINNYTYHHEALSSNLNYYRLKQVDFDGAFEYSKIVSAKNSINNLSVAIFPNPFEDVLNINFPSVAGNFSQSTSRSITIYDMFGKLVESYQIATDETNVALDLSEISKGAYIIEFKDANNSLYSQRLIKL